MNIILNNSSMIPIYEQVTAQIKSQILAGSLKPDDALPSVRALSAELRISALTVKKAYDFLEDEGFVVTVHGKGTYVAAANLELAMEARRKSVEDKFSEAIASARALGIGDNEIEEIVRLLMDN